MKLMMLIVFLLTMVTPISAMANENEFEGYRMIQVTMDHSDLENYIDGGRSTLDYTLRTVKPEWLQIDYKSFEQDLEIKMQYQFIDFNDYKNKTQQLLGKPSLSAYDSRSDVFVEYYNTGELLNFIRSALIENHAWLGTGKVKLFNVQKDALFVDDAEYPMSGFVRVGSSPAYTAMKRLKVQTKGKRDGSYSRVVDVVFSKEVSQNEVSIIRDLLQEENIPFEESSDDQESKISFKFSEKSQRSLADTTGKLLGIPVSISEQERLNGSGAVGVDYTELFDITGSMVPEGEFVYIFELPEYAKNIAADSEIADVSNGIVICTDPRGIVRFSYERDFKFHSAEIITDLSKENHRIQKKIILKAPIEVASSFHKEIKKTLEKNMTRGMTLTISDNETERCYEIEYKAWPDQDIEDFMSNITQTEASFICSRSGLPGIKSRVDETFHLTRLTTSSIPPGYVSARYILPPNSKVKNFDGEVGKGYEYSLETGINGTVELQFSYINKKLCMILGMIIFISGVGIMAAVCCIRRGKQRKTGTVFCPQCGSRNEKDSMFCATCGYKMR